MESPLPSRSNMSIGLPTIFVNKDGSSIQVFAEACSIKGRPKLMRTLRNFGASLCCDPKSAQIILVDQETTDGKKFIHNWGRDKIVLHYTWAKKSIQEGKALLKDCNWGECLTVDDGFSIEAEDPDEPEQDKSPLPTPRVTPVEVEALRSAQASSLSDPASDASRNLSPMTPSQIPANNDLAGTVTTHNHSQAMSSIESTANATDSFSQVPFSMQTNMNSIGSQMTPMMVAQMTQYMMMMMNSSNFAYNPQAQPTDFNSALIDALRIHNVQWPNSQSSQEPPVQSNMYGHQFETVPQSLPDQSDPYLNLASNIFSGSDSQSTEAPIRRKRRASNPSSDSLPTQVSLKSKNKSRSSSPVSKRHKASPSTTQPSSERKLFHSKSGKELSFFVQVDMHNRSGVVTAIKKHGGKIEGNNEIADYVILASGATKTKTFKDLLLSTVAAGRLALSARFVHHSVAQNALLDPSDYAFESPPTKTRRRPVTAAHNDDSFDEIERRRLAKNAREMSRKQRRRTQAAQATSPNPERSTSKDISTAPPTHTGPPSPTPPLEHTREALGDNFKFTDSERTYAFKYVQVLFARDHEISNHAIGAALHNKMPHHTSGSWRTHLSSPSIRDEFDRLRKRAGIVFRNTQGREQVQATQPAPQDITEFEPENSVTSLITPSPTLVDDCDTDKKMAEEDDLNTAVKFFASDEHDEENESVTWARLTSQATCKTAGSWEEFYNIHHAEVLKRYEKLRPSQ